MKPTSSGWQVPSYEVRLWHGRARRHCVVVPVINEGPRIAALMARMAQCATAQCADILIVDGGSTDGSLAPEVIAGWPLRGMLVKTGPGRLSAQLRCAYAFALDQGYDGIVTIDGNDKDDPASIPAFVQALQAGVDFAQASRFVAGGVAERTPLARLLAIRLVHAPLLSWRSGHRWTDTTQGFRAYSARALRDERVAPFRDVFSDYELLPYLSARLPRLGYRCVELPARRSYPAAGETPTKIVGLRGNLRVLRALLGACAGRFDP